MSKNLPTMYRLARPLAVLAVVLAVLSPAVAAVALPPGGSFSDDDGNVHEGYIEAIKAENITSGCNPPLNDRYCPGKSVTRGQMAAFLVRALGLSDDGGKDWFEDDDGLVFEDDINRLAAAGITSGCNPPLNDRFCPDNSVTRGQMAAFLVRAYDLSGSTSGNRFVDDDGLVFEDDIERMAAAGITLGCNPPVNDRFCPSSPVRRDAMASFLGRAEGLSPIVPPPRVTNLDVDVHVYPGENIGSVASSHPEGTVFMIHGEHHSQSVSPKDYQAFIGAGDAVMDGDNSVEYAFNSNARGVSIINIEIRDYDTRNKWRAAVVGMGGDWLVESCNIHHNEIAGIYLEKGDPVVRNNNIHHNGRSGLSVRYTDGGLIENNEIAYNNYQQEWEWGIEAGGGKMWSTTDLVIRGNWSHHNHGPGIWTDHDNIGTVYENNLIEDNIANGIFHEISYDAVIRNNVIRRNGFDHSAWLWGGGIMIASSQNVEIYGNVLEDNYNGIAMTRQNRGTGEHGEWTLANNYVHDNTVTNSGLTGAAQDVGNNTIYNSNIRFENNTYTGDVGWWWMNGEVSWSEWTDYGHDD
ncbi:MAG: right-handed parallel beta-helix repeat-containing protein [Acidimicrobiia bacterium]|nr:right-handed parallel beta-helix repeat-containing protein [Acidimicrobiia bacterium]